MSSLPENPDVRAPQRGCLEAIGRCVSLLRRFREWRGGSSDEDFRRIGPHLRHCLDHFTALERGLECGVVDYDARDRSTELETDLDSCTSAFERAHDRLASLDAPADHPLVVSQISCSSPDAHRTESTLERELVFLSGHTIHHLAVVGWICKDLGFELPESMMLAFSTEAHRQTADA